MLRFVEEGVVVAQDGTHVVLGAKSICVHSDTPGAIEMARSIRAALETAGVTIRSFV